MKSDLKITLIQSDLYWEDIDANLAMFEEKIWKISKPCDLIVLPEMFSTGFSMNPEKLAEVMNSKTFRWMKLMAAQTTAVIGGSYLIAEKGRYFNRFFAVYPDGSFQHYDKRHLFRLGGESEAFTTGKEKTLLTINGWRILPLICYDLRFPVWSRSRGNEENIYEYEAIIYCANWPTPRIRAWDALLKARAIENSAYCLGVNRVGTDGHGVDFCGHSAGYDYEGNSLGFSATDEILRFELSREALLQFRERFPFQADADSFQIT